MKVGNGEGAGDGLSGTYLAMIVIACTEGYSCRGDGKAKSASAVPPLSERSMVTPLRQIGMVL